MSKISSIGEKALKQVAMNIFNNLSIVYYLRGNKKIHQNIVPFTRDSSNKKFIEQLILYSKCE